MVFLPVKSYLAGLLGLILFAAAPAMAQPATSQPIRVDPGVETYVALLTIGVGDPLWTRFGHTALMVMREKKGTRSYHSQVYNYGAADFGASGFMWRFFRGTSKFFIARTGTFNDTVNAYAASNRPVYYQKLNLTPRQVVQVIAHLEHDARPQNREYVYHHLTAGCATRVRDLLDQVVGGAIRRQLEHQPDPHRPRYYGRLAFAGDFWAEVANDLFMGRLHDRPQSKYFALYLPRLLMEYLQQVEVPDPTGSGKLVPLAGPTTPLIDRRGAPATVGQGRTLIHLTYLLLGHVVLLGIAALWGGAAHPKRAGIWLLSWSFPMGIAAGMMVFGALASTVAEGRINELMISFPVTDMALMWVGVRWIRGQIAAGRLLRMYAAVRLGMVLLALLGHATGILFQEPRVLVLLALVCTLLLNLILWRLPRPVVDQSSRMASPS